MLVHLGAYNAAINIVYRNSCTTSTVAALVFAAPTCQHLDMSAAVHIASTTAAATPAATTAAVAALARLAKPKARCMHVTAAALQQQQ